MLPMLNVEPLGGIADQSVESTSVGERPTVSWNVPAPPHVGITAFASDAICIFITVEL